MKLSAHLALLGAPFVLGLGLLGCSTSAGGGLCSLKNQACDPPCCAGLACNPAGLCEPDSTAGTTASSATSAASGGSTVAGTTATGTTGAAGSTQSSVATSSSGATSTSGSSTSGGCVASELGPCTPATSICCDASASCATDGLGREACCIPDNGPSATDQGADCCSLNGLNLDGTTCAPSSSACLRTEAGTCTPGTSTCCEAGASCAEDIGGAMTCCVGEGLPSLVGNGSDCCSQSADPGGNCAIAPPPSPDAGPACPSDGYLYFYCGGDGVTGASTSLYQCYAGGVTFDAACPFGCLVEGGGYDQCAPPPAPPNLDGGWPTDPTVWPNTASQAAGDVWISQNHDSLRLMQPQVLVLNFVDGLTREEVLQSVQSTISGTDTGSLYHGYLDAGGSPFLSYQILGVVDLTDDLTGATPSTTTDQPVATCPSPNPSGPTPSYSNCNSTLLPRKPVPTAGATTYVDVGQLFDAQYASLFGFADPRTPNQFLDLCTLLQWGWVHELWVVADRDLNLSATQGEVPEEFSYRQIYDLNNNQTGSFTPCGGNGCFGSDDVQAMLAACPGLQSFSIAGINHSRGPGCMIHGRGHAIEGAALRVLPAFLAEFKHFANFDFDTRFGAPWTTLGWDRWYNIGAGSAAAPLISYPTDNSTSWTSPNAGGQSGSMAPFDQGCGNVHFPPNAAYAYDYADLTPALSVCEHYGLHDNQFGQDTQEIFTAAKLAPYDQWSDCGGPWQVYWRQSFPGFGNTAIDSAGHPMKNWWPYLFY